MSTSALEHPSQTSFHTFNRPTTVISNLDKLTARENQVLHLIAYEYSTKEIAKKLYVSYETANTHRKNLMLKLGAKNAAGVVRIAFELRLL